ncbi:MAG TPA: hypothetical protein IAC62_09325 [Candidatus Pelethocola excrementipullorum]|nr:hypothetical protein [Candidatus Pelethocola excrementipullorum]
MTDMQAAQIETLRMQGKGYKAIASAVGLSRDIVWNYCKANGLEGFGEAAAMNMQNRLTGQTDVNRISLKYAERADA